MYSNTVFLRALLFRLSVAYVLFLIARILFFIRNAHHFELPGVKDVAHIFMHSMQYDWCSVLYLNCVVILLHILPWKLKWNPKYQKAILWVYMLFNMPFIALELVESEYFPFTLKRLTSNVWGVRDEFLNMLPTYAMQYWYLFVLFGLLVYAITKLIQLPSTWKLPERIHYPSEILIFLGFICLTWWTVTGSKLSKPLAPIDVLKVSSQKNSAMVLNSTFTLVHSFFHRNLRELQLFTKADLDRRFHLQRNYKNSNVNINFKGRNVVIIILESFAQEYIGYYNDSTSYTPFFDSPCTKSFVCRKAYANGRRSNEGIPAVILGLPALMKDPISISPYANNKFFGIGELLKPIGYHSGFFHGAKNGSFRFDVLSKTAGFDDYYGKNEYPNPADDDTRWGIWDEPYFKYVAQVIDKAPKPYMGCVFSLTNHHPFKVPDQYIGKFPQCALPICQTIGYVDHSLAQFFYTAQTMDWYRNSIFIITADHTSLSTSESYKTSEALYRIPLIFFDPQGKLIGEHCRPVSQIDILPTLADLMHYKPAFKAFGHSVFDPNHSGKVYMYLEPTYQLITDSYSLHSNAEDAKVMFDLSADPFLQYDSCVSRPKTCQILDTSFNAIIQRYKHTLIYNEMR